MVLKEYFTENTIPIVLSALYLRGAPRSTNLPKTGWQEIARFLRREPCSLGEASTRLRKAGFWAAALTLEESHLLSWAEATYQDAHILTAADATYPTRWLPHAPPALWKSGAPVAAPLLGVVGSRQPTPEALHFAHHIGAEAATHHYAVVSGNALGCDRAGQEGALNKGGQVIAILPHGLRGAIPQENCLYLSACDPAEPFSTANAMERNALIYAASSVCFVAEARLKEGGTWHGATDALRRRLTNLAVREDPANPAHRVLTSLGATPVSLNKSSNFTSLLESILTSNNSQPTLFGHAV